MEITTIKNTSRKPYIYNVTNLETHQYYIGSQCSGKIVGVNYFTSSTNKEFKEGFKTYREEKYKIEIIKEFEDPDECGRVENYMIRDHMQLKDGLCLNRAYHCNGKKVFSRAGIPSPKKGTHLSEETKQKISIAQKGISHSEETRKKISETLRGHPAWNKGIHPSEETRKKMSKASNNQIKISIKGITFESITEASKYYNVGRTTIRRWAKNKKHNIFYIK